HLPFSQLFPYTTLFRSTTLREIPKPKSQIPIKSQASTATREHKGHKGFWAGGTKAGSSLCVAFVFFCGKAPKVPARLSFGIWDRSEEHTSELQSLAYLV